VNRRPGTRERGAATLMVLAMAGLVLMIGAALGVVGAMVVAHRRAQAAADLAALAGAVALARGDDGCVTAGEVAVANGGTLASCLSAEGDVRVVVAVAGPHVLGQVADLSARARAGSVSAGPMAGGS
jgi:secretion/DNA translocation related TadE-like protein